MLDFLTRKAQAKEILVSEDVNLSLDSCVAEHINAIINNSALPIVDGLPPMAAKAFERLQNHIQSLNHKALTVNVDHSLRASEAMAAAARTSSEIRHVDQNIHSMSAGIEELTASIKQISVTASNVSDSMGDAQEAMNQGMMATREAQESSQRIGEYFGHMNASSQDLSEAVQQIAGFITHIDALSQQTNLLALNATIESARAGEAGRGFSVVASEVKALSAQTRKVTEDIRARMQVLEARVAEMISAVETAGQLVDNSTKSSQKAETSISSLSQMIADNAQNMAEIASVLNQQDGAVVELAQGVTSLSKNSLAADGYARGATKAVGETEALIEQEMERLAACNVKNMILHRAKTDHAMWKKTLAEALAGTRTLKVETLKDHHNCRLGKWYDSVRGSAMGSKPAFTALDEPHKRVHEQGRLAVQLCHGGDMKQAWEAYLKMEKASKEVIDGLDHLIKAD